MNELGVYLFVIAIVWGVILKYFTLWQYIRTTPVTNIRPLYKTIPLRAMKNRYSTQSRTML